MKLTGENKEKFKEWLWENVYVPNAWHQYNITFEQLPPSMQWGVYVDYADSLDVFIYVLAWETEGGDYYFNWGIIGFWGDHSDNIRYESRQEAREKAIDKFNELMNEKL